MAGANSIRVVALGLLGAVAGAIAGYFIFSWLLGQGFYALASPPALLGLGAGVCARGRSVPLAIVCAVAGLLLGLYCEWTFRPWVEDDSLPYFLHHLHELRPLTWLMLVTGVVVGYRLALSADRSSPAKEIAAN
jgi:hypothetical protein